MTRFPLVSAIAFACLLGVPQRTTADEYHYKDILIGERAAGLGGAFAAISDDPSGIYYNPAGIAFARESYISLSANAFTSSTQAYKNIYTGQDFTFRSQSLVPVMIGFTQNAGMGKFGFAVITPESDAFDQSDSATNSAAGQSRTFTRRFFRQDTTYLFGPAYAMEVFKNFSVGISLLGLYRSDKMIDNLTILFDPTGNGQYFLQNIFFKRTTYALVPKLGIQFMPATKWSVGLAVSRPVNLGGSGNLQLVHSRLQPNGDLTPPNGTFNNDLEAVSDNNYSHAVSDPLSVTLGVAYFLSRTFLLSGQIDAYEARFPDLPVKAVANWSLGAEYYPAAWIAVRVGVYANNTKTGTLANGAQNQAPHVSLVGETLGLSFYRGGSSLTLGVTYASGQGQGQAFNQTTSIQTVQQSSTALALSGSFQL